MQKPPRRNSVLNSPRLSELKRKKRKTLLIKVFVLFLGLFLVIGALSYVSKIQRLNIKEIQVEGNKVIDTDIIKAVAEKQIWGNYLWLFSKANILIYPKNKIKNELGSQFKRLQDINISLSRQKMHISVSERSPEYTWCGPIPPQEAVEENCYFLDKEGYIFDKAPFFSGEVYFKFYGETSPVSDNPSGSYVAKGYFEKLILFKNRLEEMNLRPVVLYTEDGEDIKIFLSRDKILANGPMVMAKKNTDFQKIAENLKASLVTEPLLSRFKNEYAALQYLDLRFGNKVYYKFK